MGTSNEWYVDPDAGDNANDGTSDAQAWATIQYALDNITQSTTDGDFLNIKDSATATLTANLDWSSHTFNAAYPMCIRGYTSTAGDGGVPTIELDGYQFIHNAGYHNLFFWGLKFQNTGSVQASPFYFGSNFYFKECEFNNLDTGTGGRVLEPRSTNLTVKDCYFTDINGSCIYTLSNYHTLRGNYFSNTGTKDIKYCIEDGGGYGTTVSKNIVNASGATMAFFGFFDRAQFWYNNTFFTTGTATCIDDRSYLIGCIVEGNIFEGWNTAAYFRNFSQMATSISNNHFYNNTLDIYTTGNKPFMVNDGNILSAGASVLAKSGANTYANRAAYFAPIGDAVGGAANGINDIGALPAIASGGSGGIMRAAGMAGGMNG